MFIVAPIAVTVDTPSGTDDPSGPGLDDPHRPRADDVQPVANERLDRFLTGTVTLLPVVALVYGLTFVPLTVSDAVAFVVMYLMTGLGVTVGFHRLLTHRSFVAVPWLRRLLTICGSMAIEGPVISWVADHRKHHAFTDVEGDPHSPHVDHGHGLRGALRGLAHAHVGWLFIHDQRGNRERFAPDLVRDPIVSRVHDQFLLWTVVTFLLPAAIGFLLGGFTLSSALSAMLWGGLIRLVVLHHATYSINSLCHFFGRKSFAIEDESRDLAWLSLLTFGESWHNGHHAFPTSARHGLTGRQVDISAGVIGLLERAGWATNVVRVSPERADAKRV